MRTSTIHCAALIACLAGCAGNPTPDAGGDGGSSNDTLVAATTPRSVRVSVSGEKFGVEGFDYSAMPGSEPVFVDGWELRFDKYYVSIANVRLNRPGADPSVRQNLGGLIARNDGPWIVNIHSVGPDVGAGGPPEGAWPLFSFTTAVDGSRLDPAVRYAFSYDTVPATASARRIAITDDQDADVQRMIEHHWTSYIAGTATYRGRTATASVDPSFRHYPGIVRFTWGWGAPASYINCHNPSIGETDVPANRGIQPSNTSGVRAQMTVHIDHFYWDTANTDAAPLHFDPIAARARPVDGGIAEVTLDDLAGVSYSQPTDRSGQPVLDRGAQTMGYTNTGALVYQLNSAAGITDLRSFVAHNARTQGHMNAEGSCFVLPTGAITY